MIKIGDIVELVDDSRPDVGTPNPTYTPLLHKRATVIAIGSDYSIKSNLIQVRFNDGYERTIFNWRFIIIEPMCDDAVYRWLSGELQ